MACHEILVKQHPSFYIYIGPTAPTQQLAEQNYLKTSSFVLGTIALQLATNCQLAQGARGGT